MKDKNRIKIKLLLECLANGHCSIGSAWMQGKITSAYFYHSGGYCHNEQRHCLRQVKQLLKAGMLQKGIDYTGQGLHFYVNLKPEMYQKLHQASQEEFTALGAGVWQHLETGEMVGICAQRYRSGVSRYSDFMRMPKPERRRQRKAVEKVRLYIVRPNKRSPSQVGWLQFEEERVANEVLRRDYRMVAKTGAMVGTGVSDHLLKLQCEDCDRYFIRPQEWLKWKDSNVFYRWRFKYCHVCVRTREEAALAGLPEVISALSVSSDTQ